MEQQYQKTTNLNSLTFVDCLKFMRSHWYLFVVSIVICVLIACLLIVFEPNVYLRSVRIMFNENSSQSIGAINSVNFLNETATFPLKKNINNEKELFKSTYLMLDVVKRLELDVLYKNEYNPKSEKKHVQSPLKVHFLENTHGSFIMKTLSETEVELSNFSIKQDELSSDVIIAKISDTIESPIGKIAIFHTSFFSKNAVGELITVCKKDLFSLAYYYAGKLNVDIIKNSTSLKLSIVDQDIKKADDILVTLVDVYNEKYLEERKQFFESTLNFIDQSLANIDKTIVKDDTFDKKITNRGEKKSDFFITMCAEQQEKSFNHYLLQKKAEITLASINISSNCIMIDAPTGSFIPVKPKKKKILLMAVFAAFCIPYLYFCIRLFVNTKILNISEFKEVVPFFGVIPFYKKKNKEKDTIEDFIVVKKDNYSPVGESFRMLRNSIDINLSKENKCHIITFTSFEKGSGKSFTSLNTAVSFALTGKKVLFLDFDLHSKHISNLFATSSLGIADCILDDTVLIENAISKNNACPNVDFVFVGKTISNLSDILTKEKLEKIFSDLKQKYDYIFVDTASINLFTEVSVVAELSNMVLLVVCENVTDRHAFQEVETLQKDSRYKKIAVLYNKKGVIRNHIGSF